MNGVRFNDGSVIHVDLFPDDLDPVAGYSNKAFDKMFMLRFKPKNNNISPSWLTDLIVQLRDQHSIVLDQSILHRRAGNEECLGHMFSNGECQCQRPDEHLDNNSHNKHFHSIGHFVFLPGTASVGINEYRYQDYDGKNLIQNLFLGLG